MKFYLKMTVFLFVMITMGLIAIAGMIASTLVKKTGEWMLCK